jgi:hypothetical protein
LLIGLVQYPGWLSANRRLACKSFLTEVVQKLKFLNNTIIRAFGAVRKGFSPRTASLARHLRTVSTKQEQMQTLDLAGKSGLQTAFSKAFPLRPLVCANRILGKAHYLPLLYPGGG